MDGWVDDGWMVDGRVDGWMDGWKEGRKKGGREERKGGTEEEKKRREMHSFIHPFNKYLSTCHELVLRANWKCSSE